jgi:mono/diheme cytochrome c family protein
MLRLSGASISELKGCDMIRQALAIAILVLPLTATTAQPDEGPPRWAANIARKQHVIMNGLPRAYASARDPLPDTRAKLTRGASVFDRHCASCHGWNGQGSGPDAFALVPAPADLEWLRNTPKSRSEPYVYWAIAEGGEQFESDMPAFKKRLPQKDIWSVIAYLRAGMPRRSP